MSEMADRVGEALDARLKQHWLDKEPLDPKELGLIAIAAMREPTDEMTEAGVPNLTYDTRLGGDLAAHDVWQAMIDAALGGRG